MIQYLAYTLVDKCENVWTSRSSGYLSRGQVEIFRYFEPCFTLPSGIKTHGTIGKLKQKNQNIKRKQNTFEQIDLLHKISGSSLALSARNIKENPADIYLYNHHSILSLPS